MWRISTDPAKSNSGLIWSALLATSLNAGNTPTEANLPTLLPQLQAYFAAMGFMEASSADPFENFLKQGMAARPIIVGDENQMVEFVMGNQRYADLITVAKLPDTVDLVVPMPSAKVMTDIEAAVQPWGDPSSGWT